ncbi:MarR family winged helix-turn-helix transcriptional regulator [Paenarthrobacter sp. A20]|uniref:MarR family winged helix-turn-helix transcriptional regulator n=1 Tax=Paenarthrobacter sp. A20 TaxID=2817891 RepID=UPI00209DC653|nr:MarR family transcriptional regulator [Paenarthrobacter sp. A20]MCP1413867.1 DNA-binding MarR family transcriptional regulator [Paenarthrobacter sp. A20]
MTTTLPTTEPDPRDRVIWALRRAELAVQNLKDRELRALGMAAAHYTLLVSVHAEPGLAGATLARRLNVTPQAIASLVTRLEGRGLIERRTHPRHPQVQELHLTTAGQGALEQADQVIAVIEQRVVDSLGAAGSDQLRSALDRLTASIRPE